MKRTVALLLAAVLTLICCSSALAAAPDRYTITNPYADVDWESAGQYKTALHTHTNASDGSATLRQSIERHVETGFDIVAVTDHGVVDQGWDDGAKQNMIKTLLGVLGRSEGDLEYLGDEGTFADGTNYRLTKTLSGDDYLYAGERTILRLPYGVENNAVSVNAHVNSWFVNSTDNSVTTYEDAVRRIEREGGVSVINHPGEYTKARYELTSADAYDEENAAYAYYINKYAYLLDKYPSCIGIDINSKGDDRTRFERVLWDILLTRFSANGRNVFAIASSDAHQLNKIDTGFSLLLTPALSSAAARRALEKGEFFAASHCIGNPEELEEYSAALRAFYGEGNRTLIRVDAALAAMRERIDGIEAGRYDRDDSIGAEYTVLDGNGFTTVDSFPSVKAIRVDDNENTIGIETGDALIVRFVSNGRTVAVLPADDAVLDLDDYGDLIGDYVRAEVFGDGGILYTQAFLLNAEAHAGSADVVKGVRELGFLDFLLAEINRWMKVIARFFRSVT
ncbi:MAG: hypothetical protein IK104_10350 [Clostridia bacterium]|nr:hypothetical protein [Clostridia bacterium]